MESNNNKPNDPKKPDRKPRLWVTVLISVGILLLISAVYNFIRSAQFTQTSMSDFLTAWEENNLSEVEIQYDRIIYLTKEEAEKPAAQQQAFYTGIPSGCDTLALSRELHAQGVTVYKPVIEDNSGIMMVLYYVAMFGVVFRGYPYALI